MVENRGRTAIGRGERFRRRRVESEKKVKSKAPHV